MIGLSNILFTKFTTYNLHMQKYSKFIKELLKFINDLSTTCSICSTQVFDWYLCRIQYKKNSFFFRKSLTPLCSLCKLYHETDCHLFDEYKHKDPLWNNHNHTQGTTRNIPWVFFQEHTHPLIETSSCGSHNSQEFDRDL